MERVIQWLTSGLDSRATFNGTLKSPQALNKKINKTNVNSLFRNLSNESIIISARWSIVQSVSHHYGQHDRQELWRANRKICQQPVKQMRVKLRPEIWVTHSRKQHLLLSDSYVDSTNVELYKTHK